MNEQLKNYINMVDGCMDSTLVEPEDNAAWLIVKHALEESIAAALASPADALVADSAQPEANADAKAARYDYLASKGFDIEFISGEDGHTTIATSYCYSGPKEKFAEWVGKQIDAAIQAQKDGHG